MRNATPSLLKKLADFKQLKIVIPKDTKAYGYNYAPLDTILPIIEPELAKLGLSYFHNVDIERRNRKTYLKTTIYEIEGEPNAIGGGTQLGGYITSRTLIDEDTVLAKMNKFMVMGSALTYFRRYHLVVMLGLLTDEDTDAGGGTGGRSVETTPFKKDYIKTFRGLIENKQTEKQVRTFYKNYKKNFSEEEDIAIKELMETTFKK